MDCLGACGMVGPMVVMGKGKYRVVGEFVEWGWGRVNTGLVRNLRIGDGIG